MGVPTAPRAPGAPHRRARRDLLAPHRPYQDAIFRAVMESVRGGHGRTFSVMISRQGGKNELSARLQAALLVCNLDREVNGIKCAPTFRPQGLVSLRRLWSCLRALDLPVRARIEGGHAIRLHRARQLFLSAEPAAHAVGHTAHLLLEADEAQDIDADKFDKDFRPMAATTNATTIYYGTAWSETDLLAEMRRRHLELEQRDGIRRHFEFDWQAVAPFIPAYADFVAAERERLGEDHPLFVTQYLLRPLPGGGRLFAPAQRALLRGVHPRLHAPAPTEDDGRLLGYVAGLDIGGETFANAERAVRNLEGSLPAHAPPPAFRTPRAHDFTVLTIARVLAPQPRALTGEPELEIVEHAAWQGASHTELVGGIARLLRVVWRVRRVVIDATGVGEGLASALVSARFGDRPGSTAGSTRPATLDVVRLRLTEERKSALGYALLAAVNGGRLRCYRQDGSPEHAELWREVERARAEYRPNRRLAWFVDPTDGHDDFLMSLALTVEAARNLTPRVARGRDGARE